MKEILFKPDEVKIIKEGILAYYGTNTKESKKIIGKLERAEKKIKVSSAKGKGRGLQYWVCDRIAKMFGLEFIQSDDDCLIQSRPMGQHSVDIILRGELKKKYSFSIECKCQENLSLPEWIRQARENTLPNTYWMLVFKKQTIGHEPLVVMEWDTFERLFEKGKNNER